MEHKGSHASTFNGTSKSDGGADFPPVKTAIIPSAGLSTRAFPAAAFMHKSSFLVDDKPTFHFWAEQLSKAGIKDIVFVVSPGDEIFLERGYKLHQNEGAMGMLRDRGKTKQVEFLEDLGRNYNVSTVVQEEALGLGHAVSMGADHVNGNAFMVVLQDEILFNPENSVIDQLVDVYGREGGNVLATTMVPRSEIATKGTFTTPNGVRDDRTFAVDTLIEKPAADVIESTFPGEAYPIMLYPAIFQPQVMDRLCVEVERAKSMGADYDGVGGEIQMTDLRLLQGMSTTGYNINAERFDCGTPQGLKTANRFFDEYARAKEAMPGAGHSALVAVTREVIAQQDQARQGVLAHSRSQGVIPARGTHHGI